jgi:hypothetical protein
MGESARLTPDPKRVRATLLTPLGAFPADDLAAHPVLVLGENLLPAQRAVSYFHRFIISLAALAAGLEQTGQVRLALHDEAGVEGPVVVV